MIAFTPLMGALLRRPLAQILLIVLLHSFVVTASSIWDVDIDYDPAPSPEDSPPFSRNASRDPALLKYQIIGIAGAYVAAVVIIGLGLLTYGRHARQKAQAGRDNVTTEMVKPNRWTMKPSPVSPGSASRRSWRSWTKRSPSMRNSKFSATQSVMSVDPTVLEADKAKREQEMERLYAAVLDEDQKKSPELNVHELQRQQEMSHLHQAALDFEQQHQHSQQPPQREDTEAGEREIDPVTGQVLSHRRNPSTSSRSFSQRKPPPRADTASADSTNHYQGTATQQSQQQSWDAQSHRSQAHAQGYGPERARSPPTQAGFQEDRGPQTFPVSDRLPESPYSPERSRPRANRQASAGSNKLKKGGGTSNSGQQHSRNLTISAPIQNRYPSSGSDADDFEASRPLSPRQYSPGAPPSPPTRASTTSPNFAAPVGDDGYADDEDIIYAYGYEGLDSRRPIPHAAPHRGGPLAESSQSSAHHAHLPASPRGFQQPQQMQTPMEQAQTQGQGQGQQSKRPPQLRLNSDNQLPLRNYKSAAPHSSTTPVSPTSPSGSKKVAPTPTKTTFLSPRRENFTGMAPLTGTTPGGLPAGWTALSPRARAAVAGPSTPYSPYMPRTPMTPITPRLVTKADRKARAKEQHAAAITEEEEVKDERDVWGDGFS